MKHTTTTLASALALFLSLAQPVLARPDNEVRNDESQRIAQQEPKVKPGSKDDIDAIGNREIGGRGLGNWYSLETEIRIGREYAQMIDRSVRLVQDPVITEYVNRIGQNIVRNSDSQVPFTIKVIDASEVNAFALPGGFFYVNSGLLLATGEEAELAGVMAHEVAHVAARHAVRQMTRAHLANIASIPLIFVGGGGGGSGSRLPECERGGIAESPSKEVHHERRLHAGLRRRLAEDGRSGSRTGTGRGS